MTEPANPVPARVARPQLFGTPRRGHAQQPDFGPSILATIDSQPRRGTKTREGISIRRVMWMTVVALAAVAVYFAVKLGVHPREAFTQPVASTPAVVAVESKELVPIVAAEVPANAPVPGAATIENVEASQPALVAALHANNVASSVSNIHEVLARSESVDAPHSATPPAPREKSKAKSPRDHTAVPKPAATKRVLASPSAKPSKAVNDTDTELLAAMLPHLNRRTPPPTSAAYEKRCGRFTGDSEAQCRAKFCNGREGADAACPVARR